MSLEIWTLPTSRSSSLIAEKTGRSGQPTQKPGGRSGSGPPSRRCASARPARAASKRSRGLERSMSLADWAKNFSRPVGHHLGGVLARHRQHVLAVDLGVDVALAQDRVDRLLDVVGRALLDDQHGALALAEVGDLVGHQRMGDVQHQRRDLAFDLQPVEAAQQHVGDAALHDDAEVGALARQELVQAVLDDEALGRGLADLDLDLLVRVGRRRMRDAVVVVRGRIGEPLVARDRRRLVVLGDELAGDVAGADAQLHHHRRVGRLRQFERLLRAAHDRRQVGPRDPSARARISAHRRGRVPG